jgi:site-specific DNA-methyltransferase (adenine-specific)
MPKSNFEPWGIFRKPLEGTVAANLRKWKTGGFRRVSEDLPFGDVFKCPPASDEERRLAEHPTLKPQRLMRHLVRAVLPLGEGVVLDTFDGSGSTLAAAEAIGVHAIGLERNEEYAAKAVRAIPRLKAYSAATIGNGSLQLGFL